MGEEKKKGSVLPPYTAAEITNAAIAKAGGTLPKGLILVKENRPQIDLECIFESAPSSRYDACYEAVREDRVRREKGSSNTPDRTAEHRPKKEDENGAARRKPKA